LLDSTAAHAMSGVAVKAQRQGIRLYITGASPTVRRALLTHGVRPPSVRYRETIARAVADIKLHRDEAAVAPGVLAAG
jgi:SulP family sulfate permease